MAFNDLPRLGDSSASNNFLLASLVDIFLDSEIRDPRVRDFARFRSIPSVSISQSQINADERGALAVPTLFIIYSELRRVLFYL